MMKKYFIIMGITILAIIIVLILMAFKSDDLFYGLSPKAVYGEYKIYDLVEQRNLACAEMIEMIGSDDTYDYYFNCLRSDQIYLVSKDEIIKVKVAMAAGIITKEKLYELGIIDRMERVYE